MEIKLTQQENDLIESIKNFVTQNNINITPRIAGGWVRDKLMGISSSDIDIVLDNMSGLEFAKLYKNYMKKTKNYLSKIGVVKENPTQSKHIETAVVKVFRMFVDFLQLRSEEYVLENNKKNTTDKQNDDYEHLEIKPNTFDTFDAFADKDTKDIDNCDDIRNIDTIHTNSAFCNNDISQESLISSSSSRIPIIKPASVIEDALRRDITINTLYYNIMTNEIEDMIGDGLSDIKKQLIRTPLEPYKTFMDDPLRILRVIRFAVRFNFVIQENIVQVFRNKNVKDAFVNKISRERVGTEILKIIKHESGMKTLCMYGLCDIVFYENSAVEPKIINKYFDVLDEIMIGNKQTDNKIEKMESKTIDIYVESCKNLDEHNKKKKIQTDKNMSEIKQRINEIRTKKLTKRIKITKFNIISEIKSSETKKYKFDLEFVSLFAYLYFFIGQRHNNETINSYICKEKLKLSNFYTKTINKIEENVKYIQKLVMANTNAYKHVSINQFIDLDITETGNVICNTSIGVEYVKIVLIKIVRFCREEYINTMVILQCHKYEQEIIKKIYDLVEKYNYEGLHLVKPILNGHKIKEIFGVQGQAIKEMVEKGLILQILYDTTNEEDLIEKLRE